MNQYSYKANKNKIVQTYRYAISNIVPIKDNQYFLFDRKYSIASDLCKRLGDSNNDLNNKYCKILHQLQNKSHLTLDREKERKKERERKSENENAQEVKK